jgi:hypothetical protein
MNYLKRHIEGLFIECTGLNANLKVLDSFVSERRSELSQNFPFPGQDLISMISAYRDLSQLEGGNNLYTTNVDYKLTTDNLSSEVNRLLSYFSCLTVTQIFEVFESFLKNMLAEIISQNPVLMDILKLECESASFDSVRRCLYKIQGKSNKGFIKVLRIISPFFKTHEENNIWKRNMSHWFDLIGRVRDLVIHSRLKINSEFELYIKESHRSKLFNLHFTISGDRPNAKISLTPYQAYSIIDYIFEYAHLIYKGLSIDFKIDLDFNFENITLTN